MTSAAPGNSQSRLDNSANGGKRRGPWGSLGTRGAPGNSLNHHPKARISTKKASQLAQAIALFSHKARRKLDLRGTAICTCRLRTPPRWQHGHLHYSILLCSFQRDTRLFLALSLPLNSISSSLLSCQSAYCNAADPTRLGKSQSIPLSFERGP